jgi:hypothetical protein
VARGNAASINPGGHEPQGFVHANHALCAERKRMTALIEISPVQFLPEETTVCQFGETPDAWGLYLAADANEPHMLCVNDFPTEAEALKGMHRLIAEKAIDAYDLTIYTNRREVSFEFTSRKAVISRQTRDASSAWLLVVNTATNAVHAAFSCTDLRAHAMARQAFQRLSWSDDDCYGVFTAYGVPTRLEKQFEHTPMTWCDLSQAFVKAQATTNAARAVEVV